ncbi:hypothetical protein BH09BAC4_BH09BAC4_46970 [soil metagenome]
MCCLPKIVLFILLLFAITSLTSCEREVSAVYSTPCGLQSLDNYYWNFNEKIKVEPAPYSLLLISKDTSTNRQVRQWLSQNPLVGSTAEASFNVAVAHLYQDERKRLEFLDAIVKRFPDVVVSQSITYRGSIIHVLNQVDLKPNANTDIQSVIRQFGDSVKLIRSTQYNTYLFEVATCKNAMDVANRIQESGLVEWCTPNFLGTYRVL